MKNTRILAVVLLVLGLIVCFARISEAEPMGTAFTYQGRLMDANFPADGPYDFEFRLFDDPCTGTQQGNTIGFNDLDVIDGYFTVELDFGSDVFDGDARWLDIGVRPGGKTSAYTKLSPRQEVTPTPYALHTYGLTVVGNNTFIGKDAGTSNTTGYENTFSGYEAGYSNTTGHDNTFSGYLAGYSNTIGSLNTFSGYRAGYSNTTGRYNTFSGNMAGFYNTTGNSNTFSGCLAGFSNTEGNDNTFSGHEAGFYNTTGNYNTFSGYKAGHSNTTGNYNTFSGYLAGHSNTTGSGNVFIGFKAGRYETGSNKLYIANSDGTPLIYGDFSTGRVGIGTTSPQRRLHIDSYGKSDPVIIANGKANTEVANSLLNSLPNSTLIIGGPWSDKIYFYWKDESGNKYYTTLSGTSF